MASKKGTLWDSGHNSSTIPFVPGHWELQRGKKKRSSTCRNGYPSLPPKEPDSENLPEISSWGFLGVLAFLREGRDFNSVKPEIFGERVKKQGVFNQPQFQFTCPTSKAKFPPFKDNKKRKYSSQGRTFKITQVRSCQNAHLNYI